MRVDHRGSFGGSSIRNTLGCQNSSEMSRAGPIIIMACLARLGQARTAAGLWYSLLIYAQQLVMMTC